ncbi:hypothetical protein BK004_01210 [bacterium CG10_46_32]|nr:MAG: hypothetical protein BK004_01210 [bacterium CG10_46_32]PIR56317.1 MAG: hypothetical protein COU73_01225 [Parcubacteria group bacterium CG10_big_fil_rev_8_21_14_0_10_46_32]
MKRIALFSVTYDPFIGGAEVAIKEITNQLNEYEFDLFTARLSARLPHEERIGHINVYRLGSGRPFLDKFLYPWRAFRLAAQLHAKNPYHLVHAVIATYAGLGALLFKRKYTNVPYLLTLQSGDPDEFINKRTWFWRKTYAKIYTKADIIIAISSWLKDRAKRYGYAGEVVIIPNGVDVSSFSGSQRSDERAFIRKSWGLLDSDFAVVTASRLVHKNGVDILIASLMHLPEHVKIVIAGSGEDEEKLKVQSEEFNNRVVFLGQMRHEDLPRVLKACDVFVRPSRSEGLGNSFIEAKAAGLPVIGTAVGGIKDLIQVGIVEPTEGTPEAIAEKIKFVMQDPNHSSSRQEIIVQRYSWDVIARQYDEEYKKLIA